MKQITITLQKLKSVQYKNINRKLETKKYCLEKNFIKRSTQLNLRCFQTEHKLYHKSRTFETDNRHRNKISGQPSLYIYILYFREGEKYLYSETYTHTLIVQTENVNGFDLVRHKMSIQNSFLLNIFTCTMKLKMQIIYQMQPHIDL